MNLKTTVGSRSLAASSLALVLLLAPVPPASAETFLVAVDETEDGQACPPPSAAREGIFAALFDAEHIAFEFPAAGPTPSTDDLCRLALEAGAGTIAMIVVEWHREPIPGGALRVRGRGTIVIIDARSGREMSRFPLEVGNEGREATADRPRLASEIGSALIEAYRVAAAAP